MDQVTKLAAELDLPAYQALSDAAAAARLNAPVDGTRGPLDLDWLDSLLVQTGRWPVVEAAAEGDIPAPVGDGQGAQPAGSITAEQAAGATLAARQVHDLIRSPRRHGWLDTALTEFGAALALLVAAGVITAGLAAAVTAAARLTRAQQLGLSAPNEADVARARRYLAKGVR